MKRTQWFSKALVIALCATGTLAQAAVLAADSASDVAYLGGWSTGQNGGFGFAPWNLVPMSEGGSTFIATGSAVNIPVNGPAWGLASGQPADAYSWHGLTASRFFLQPLRVGDQFKIDFDSNTVPVTPVGSGITIALRNTAKDELTAIWVYRNIWYNSGPNYQLSGVGNSAIPLQIGGLTVTVRPLSDTTFQMTLQPQGGAMSTFNGIFKGGKTGPITSFDVQCYNNGVGTNGELYVNNVAVTGESTVRHLKGRIDFGDRTGALPATVRIAFREPGTSTVIDTVTAGIGADGSYDVVAPGPQTYDVSVQPRPYLRRTLPVDLTAGSQDGFIFPLVAGDIDGDNAVTVFDYDKLSVYFDLSDGSAGWGTADGDGVAPQDADLDGDGSVTVFDYDILSTNFDRAGDD